MPPVRFLRSILPNCLLIGIFTPFIFNVIFGSLWLKSDVLIYFLVSFIFLLLCFLFLPLYELPECFLEFHLDLSILLCLLLCCIASLVVALGIT